MLCGAADGLSHCAADSRVHFIEDQRADRRVLGCDEMDREAQARKLASGRNLRERPQRQARMR